MDGLPHPRGLRRRSYNSPEAQSVPCQLPLQKDKSAVRQLRSEVNSYLHLTKKKKTKKKFFFSFWQVKTELTTQGGAQGSGCQSQTKISSQPSVAWPRHLGQGAEKVMKRFFSKPGNKAAVNISTEGDPSGKIL